MTPLQRRKALFAEFSSKFEHRKVSDLISVVRTPWTEFHSLRHAVNRYISCGSLNERTTPNGIVVPDRDSALEFNAVSREFYRAMSFLPRDHVPSWNVPLSLRVKHDDGRRSGISPRATEMPHCDGWVGECPNSVIMQLYVYGTRPGNCVRYRDPPDDFQEEWIGWRPFEEGQEIAARYKPLDFVPQDGDVVLTDISVIHHTQLEAPQQSYLSGNMRVSIDTTFGLEDAGLSPERQHRGTRAGWDVVIGLGQTHLLVFPNRRDERADDGGGKKQAVNCQLKQLC